MQKYNYGRVFYDENIFDLENDNDVFKKAIIDSYKIENYLLEKTPNIDAIRNLIINSYKLNKTKSLFGKNRLYYTIGIAYSMEYINLDDLNQFISHIQSSPYIDDQSIFQRKGFANNINGFFVDAFEEDLVELKDVEKYSDYLPDSQTIYYCTECGEKVSKDDTKCPNCGEDLNEIIENSEDAFINVKDFEDDEIGEYEDENEDLMNCYVDISASKKIELFKDNFEEFINHQLERKQVEGITKTKYIIKGMRDWFNYCIYFFDEVLDIENNRVMVLTSNIGKYL